MAHVAERNVSHYLPMLCGFTITCCPDAREVIAYLPEVKPTWFFAVPRIWEKLKAGLEQMLAAAPAEQRAAAERALSAAIEKVRLEQRGEEVPAELAEGVEAADKEMFSGSADHLGLDELRGVQRRGGADAPGGDRVLPRPRDPARGALGDVRDDGRRHLQPAASGSRSAPSARRRPNVEIKLAEDGEVMIKGPVVMKGYRNLPEKTAETFTDDGFLLTGDIGEFDEDGYLRIVDRKKELIITAAGKNLSPANIEARLKQVPLVSQAIAIGDRRKYISALLTLDAEAATRWAGEHEVDGDPREPRGQ